MMVIGLGALLVFGGVLYMVRTVIWRGSLSGSGSSRCGPVRNTLEPPRRGVGFLARNELAGHSPYGNRCNSVGVGGQFLALANRAYGPVQ
jgi:hypothetical protein